MNEHRRDFSNGFEDAKVNGGGGGSATRVRKEKKTQLL